MASKSKSKNTSSKAVTPPKGRPTAARSDVRSGRRLSPTMEWVLAAIVVLAIIGGLIFLFGDVRSTTTGGLGADVVGASTEVGTVDAYTRAP